MFIKVEYLSSERYNLSSRRILRLMLKNCGAVLCGQPISYSETLQCSAACKQAFAVQNGQFFLPTLSLVDTI